MTSSQELLLADLAEPATLAHLRARWPEIANISRDLRALNAAGLINRLKEVRLSLFAKPRIYYQRCPGVECRTLREIEDSIHSAYSATGVFG